MNESTDIIFYRISIIHTILVRFCANMLIFSKYKVLTYVDGNVNFSFADMYGKGYNVVLFYNKMKIISVYTHSWGCAEKIF